MRFRLTACGFVFTVAWCLGTASAQAYVYWSNTVAPVGAAETIGRADLDGTGARQSYIDRASIPKAVAVDAGHIYWANFPSGGGPGGIGRADIGGGQINQSFIAGPVSGIAVNASHIYWAVLGQNAIGRANLDGSAPNPSFIPEPNVVAVAVDATYVYWATGYAIGRAKLDGTGVESHFIDIPGGGSGATSLAVDAAHIYWANTSGFGTIARANLDGTGVNDLIAGTASQPMLPTGVAVDAAHLYWSDGGFGGAPTGSIGRANLDGSSPNRHLADANRPSGVAVDALATIPTTMTLASSKKSISFGEDPVFTATVANASPDPLPPSGKVQFQVNGVADGGPVDLGADGRAEFSPTDLLNAGDGVSAVYAGDNRHGPATADAGQQVQAAISSTALFSSANPAPHGNGLVFVAAVSNASTGIIPFGSVQFFVDGKLDDVLPLNEAGRAADHADDLSPGRHVVQARYEDDTGFPPDFIPSQASLTQVVSAPASTPPPPAVASFKTSPTRLVVSKNGSFRYHFLATPLTTGTISLRSTKKLKIGSKKRRMTLAPRVFTSSPGGDVKIKFKLSGKNLKALRHIRGMGFIVTVAFDGKPFTTRLMLKAPKKA